MIVLDGFAMISACVTDVGERDHRDRLLHVVKHDHVVEERERKVGQSAVVLWGIGEMLGVADGVVSGIPHRAAAEPG